MNQDQKHDYSELPRPIASGSPASGPSQDDKIHFYAEPEVDPLQEAVDTLGQRTAAWLGRYGKRLLQVIFGCLLIVIALLIFTDAKYAVMNLFGRASLTVTVVDASTKQPVPGATVTNGIARGRTDDSGRAVLKEVPFGNSEIIIEKPAYSRLSHRFKIVRGMHDEVTTLNATGTLLRFKVTDLISQQPVKGAKASFMGSDAIGDANGLVVLSVPPQQEGKVAITLSKAGMTSVTKTVSTLIQDVNQVGLVPEGRVYFLSGQFGRIDIMKANLDGSDKRMVVMGTGKEDSRQTMLLASHDWKYLLLKANREGAEKLYLLNTHNDSLRAIDDEKAAFSLVGWSGHQFIYTVERVGARPWQSKVSAIKTFNADSGKLAIVDENLGKGGTDSFWLRQVFSGPHIVNDGLVYGKYWAGTMAKSEEQQEIVHANADGSKKRVLKALRATDSERLASRPRDVTGVYFESIEAGSPRYYRYQQGEVKPVSLNSGVFQARQPALLLSPDTKATVWQVRQVDKNSLFIGDGQGQNGVEVASARGVSPYGWFTDRYIIVSKDANQLLVMPRGGFPPTGPLKITDYFRPGSNSDSYTHGYGGL